MYALMYAMVDELRNVHPNLNQAYMAGLMAAPMVLLELALMRSMYPDRRVAEIRDLCGRIVKSQREEIAQMREMLRRLER